MNRKDKFPKKQVHLDFHTSPDIGGIGSRFSKENFQAALKEGRLDSITVFAKCHHGLCYFPTEVGTMHPGLDFDLTGAMIEAAHEIGVRAPVYITAGWSDLDAKAHPEWREKFKDGRYITSYGDTVGEPDDVRYFCSWDMMCLADGEYCEHIYALTEEVCKRYHDLDGLFYDICVMGDSCYCDTCVAGMRLLGLDPENEEDAKEYYIIKRRAFMKKCSDILKKYHPTATIFFNGGGANQYQPQYHEFPSHYEMEDLPTAWGGYDKLPIRAKFFKNYNKGLIGMTGKFHLDWGEFGGFKTKEALRYEVAAMALYGAGCSIGDHAHPDMEMEGETYRYIGFAYEYLDKIAPYCYGGESAADIGLFAGDNGEENEGVSNILLENQLDFDVVFDNKFDKYSLVIIPSSAKLDAAATEALEKYIADGGKLLFMGNALVNDGKFAFDFGFDYLAAPEFDCDYLITDDEAAGLPKAPMLCYMPGHRVENRSAKVLAEFITPYFARTNRHFCGHKNTPHNKDSKHYPAILKSENAVYLAHSMPLQYKTFGSVFFKRAFMLALSSIYDNGVLKVSGMGSQGRCTMIRQDGESRYCVNLLYASPVKRGSAEIIEDIIPIYNVALSLKTKEKVKRVYAVNLEKELDFTEDNGRISFNLPKLELHESVVIEY